MVDNHHDRLSNQRWPYLTGMLVLAASLAAVGYDWGEGGFFGWIEKHKGLAAWVQAVGSVIAILVAVYIGYLENKRSARLIRTADVAGRNLMPVLVRLAELRKEGVELRNNLSSRRVLTDEHMAQLSEWEMEVMDEIKKISPAQAQTFATLDIIPAMSLPTNIARHPELIHHTERLKRLKEFIDRYDPAISTETAS